MARLGRKPNRSMSRRQQTTRKAMKSSVSTVVVKEAQEWSVSLPS